MTRVERLKEYAKLSSAHFALLTAMIPLMGALAMGETNIFHLIPVFIIGLLAHIYGFAFNHYNDIEIDRQNPELNERPLAKGVITKKHALIYIMSVFLLSIILTTIFFFDLIVLSIFLIAMFLATLYDIYSKKIPGMDFVLAASIATIAIFGSATVSLNFTPLAYIIWILAFIQTINLNLIAGGLKDIENDQNRKCKTAAIKLGVKVENGIFHASLSFIILAFIFGISYAILSLIPFLFNIINYYLWQLLLVLFLNIIYLYTLTKMLISRPFIRKDIRKNVVISYNVNWAIKPIILMSVTMWLFILILLPFLGLIASNFLLYRTILRPKVM